MGPRHATFIFIVLIAAVGVAGCGSTARVSHAATSSPTLPALFDIGALIYAATH
jgi:hypothetical protein